MSARTVVTRIFTDSAGRRRRQIREYTLRGGGEALERRVSSERCQLGSHPSNEIVIADPSVSRVHAEIEATSHGYAVRDLGSTNGTYIDGLRVVEAFLPDRARLRFGRVELDFSLRESHSDIPASSTSEFQGLLGQSTAMRELFVWLERVAPTNTTVLVEGESGTGKERVASAVHRASTRANGPFVVLDCAALPATLVESEIFGHVRGAFTGANAARDGRFVEADGGTLFLDEVGELPLELQPKLLRALESREVRAVGATASRAVDVRVVAATNRDLAREVNRGTFREDLYYRLAVVKVRVPPLRERREDIPLLVAHFVRELHGSDHAAADRALEAISPENWRKLERLPWPGNVRELRNLIERTLILSERPLESPLPLPSVIQAGKASSLPGIDLSRPFTEHKATLVEAFERAYLLGQLAAHDQNISAAARAAGLDRMNYKRLLKKYL